MGSLGPALLYCLGIYGLLMLDRSAKRISNENIVPLLWFLIAFSRPISGWGSAPMSRGEVYLEGSPLDRSILMLMIAVGFVILYRRPEQVRAIMKGNVALIAFMIYCLVSIGWAEYGFVAFKRWIRLLGDIVMVMVIITDGEPGAALRWIYGRVAYILVPLSILFIRSYPELGRTYTRSGAPMWTGVCTDKNALGALCMIVGAVILWRWSATFVSPRSRERNYQLIAMSVVFAMIVYLLVLIDSKTALICFAIAGTVVLVRRLFKRPLPVLLFVVASVTACYAVLFAGVGGGALETMGRDSSLTGRTEVWDAVLAFAGNPWVGVGYENFWLGERLDELAIWGGNQAHNGYLEIYINLGWIGLLFLAVMILAGYMHIHRALRDDAETGRLRVAFFLICLIYNFTEASFKMMSPVWMAFLWATIAAPSVGLPALRGTSAGVVARRTAWPRITTAAAR